MCFSIKEIEEKARLVKLIPAEDALHIFGPGLEILATVPLADLPRFFAEDYDRLRAEKFAELRERYKSEPRLRLPIIDIDI